MQQCPDCASLRARHRHPSQKSAPEDTNPNLSIALPYNRMLFNSLVVYFFLCEVRVFVFQGKSKCYSFGYLKNHPSKHRQRPTSLSVCLSVCLSIRLFVLHCIISRCSDSGGHIPPLPAPGRSVDNRRFIARCSSLDCSSSTRGYTRSWLWHVTIEKSHSSFVAVDAVEQDIIENVAESQHALEVRAFVDDDEAMDTRLADRVEDCLETVIDCARIYAGKVLSW